MIAPNVMNSWVELAYFVVLHTVLQVGGIESPEIMRQVMSRGQVTIQAHKPFVLSSTVCTRTSYCAHIAGIQINCVADTMQNE